MSSEDWTEGEEGEKGLAERRERDEKTVNMRRKRREELQWVETGEDRLRRGVGWRREETAFVFSYSAIRVNEETNVWSTRCNKMTVYFQKLRTNNNYDTSNKHYTHAYVLLLVTFPSVQQLRVAT